jgi:hypothetical protein
MILQSVVTGLHGPRRITAASLGHELIFDYTAYGKVTPMRLLAMKRHVLMDLRSGNCAMERQEFTHGMAAITLLDSML